MRRPARPLWGPGRVLVRCDGCRRDLSRDSDGRALPVRVDYLPAVLKLEAWAAMRVLADGRDVDLCPGCYDLELDDAGEPRLIVREHARASVPDAPLARSLT